jgi:L-ascorbate metabolism protein UlaG (beta-lactamase superfamily)
MVEEWRASHSSHAVWLMYAANYLFDTGGIRWAVDPVLLDNKVPEAPALDVREDLAPLQLVLLTHAHSDHVDVRLWNLLSSLDCHWVVPDHMVPRFVEATSLPQTRLSVAEPGRQIEVDGVRILPYASPHNEQTALGEERGVPETGYLVEVGACRYLLPGDIRTYDLGVMPAIGPVTALFAHVFLGRMAALSAHPPLLDAFASFCLALQPKKVLLTHLYEVSREAADCWGEAHAQMAREAIGRLDGAPQVLIPGWYTETGL